MSSMPRPPGALILVVDDDASVRASLSLLLKQAGHRALAAAAPAEALEVVASQAPQLVLQDMNFTRKTTGEEGLALLREIRARRPELPVVLMTAWGSIALAVEGMRAGASDFITKPWTNPQILQAIDTALGLAAAPTSEGSLPGREELDAAFDFGNLVGEDPRLLRILRVVGRVAPTDASVLITGESGTGKELIAEAIHRNSRRKAGPFVKVNLGGISAPLFDSEMFGHVRGAFTDARQDRKGRFEVAGGGTIFLDEIGELDPAAQVKLLRVLQDRTFEVLGSSTSRTVDVRVVSATNRNLADMVARGQFREDLLYRLNLIALHLPPLRERSGDIPRLAGRFLQAVAQVHRRGDLTFSPAALAWLQAMAWPGNVRQLRQGIERAVLMGQTRRPAGGGLHQQRRGRGPRGGRARRQPPRGGEHDHGRDRAGHDRQVAGPPRRQPQPGGRVAGPEPGRPLPPPGEIRHPPVKLHARFVLYVVLVNAAAGAVAAPFLVTNPIWLVAAEGVLLVSLLVGLRLVRGLFRTLAVIQDGAQFLQEGDFTARLRATGQPELDRLVGVYNQMVDHLRDERARLQEQHHFLAQILEQSPSAIVVLDFDGAISLCNPAALRLLGAEGSPPAGRRLSDFPPEATLAQTLAALSPGETRVVPLPDGRRLKCRRGPSSIAASREASS